MTERFSIVKIDVEGDRFVGHAIRCDADFVPKLVRVGHYAEECGLYVHVTSSLRNSIDVPGAIVDPAKLSNHLVGHAIDMNLVRLGDRGEVIDFYNSTAFRLEVLDPDVKRFFDMIRADKDLRYGGDFRKPDVVHIDDGLNINEPEVWLAKYESRLLAA